MARSWKSQIADEVRAASMSNPKWPDDAMARIRDLVEDNDRLRAELAEARNKAPDSDFQIFDFVRKKSGSWWEGRVVGHYSTDQTPDGVCVQLDKPYSPVQIYPASALELVNRALKDNT